MKDSKLVKIILVFSLLMILLLCLFFIANRKSTWREKILNKNLTILIYQTRTEHTEVGTGVAYALHKLNPDIKLEVYFPPHKLNCFDTYIEEYPKNIKKIFSLPNIHYLEKYDVIVLVSLYKSLRNFGPNLNMIRIGHIKTENSYHNMALSPLVHENNILLPTPTFKYIQNRTGKPIVVIIGLSRSAPSGKNRDIEDINKLILSKKINVAIISRFPVELIMNEMVTVKANLPNDELNKYLRTNNTFIWIAAKRNGVYHRDRFSGAINSALSLNVPLIMDEKLCAIYKSISAISYKKSILEIIDEIKTHKHKSHVLPTKKKIHDVFSKALDEKEKVYKSHKNSSIKENFVEFFKKDPKLSTTAIVLISLGVIITIIVGLKLASSKHQHKYDEYIPPPRKTSDFEWCYADSPCYS